MTITINATGAERKRLVQTIAQWLGCEAKYLGVPSCAYQVDYFTIEKNGSLTFDDSANSEVIERLLQHIYDEGFDIDQSHTEDEPEDEKSGICISMPRSIFTDSNLENLKAIIAAKGNLIKKALGADDLPIEVTEFKVSFPWFPAGYTPDELNTYGQFIEKLCEMARNQKRVTAKEKETDNEKYAFRCFLLRLGFIGNEYKVARKIPELTPHILHEFVDKIVVHSASDPHSRTKRRQEVDIYYKGIGILEMSKVFATRENERNGIV